MHVDAHPVSPTPGVDRHHLAVTTHVGHPSTHEESDDFGLRHHESIFGHDIANGATDHLGGRLPKHLDFEDLGHEPSCDNDCGAVHVADRATL